MYKTIHKIMDIIMEYMLPILGMIIIIGLPLLIIEGLIYGAIQIMQAWTDYTYTY